MTDIILTYVADNEFHHNVNSSAQIGHSSASKPFTPELHLSGSLRWRKIKNPRWEGFGRLKALPTKYLFHWYEKQINRP